MFDAKKFGIHFAELRKSVGMTQSELAAKLYLTRQAISKYETGKAFPDVSTLVMLAGIFGITLDALIHSGEDSDS